MSQVSRFMVHFFANSSHSFLRTCIVGPKLTHCRRNPKADWGLGMCDELHSRSREYTLCYVMKPSSAKRESFVLPDLVYGNCKENPPSKISGVSLWVGSEAQSCDLHSSSKDKIILEN